MEMPPKRALVGLSGRFLNFSPHRVVTTQSLLHYTPRRKCQPEPQPPFLLRAPLLIPTFRLLPLSKLTRKGPGIAHAPGQ